jgi:hypothetical protein
VSWNQIPTVYTSRSSVTSMSYRPSLGLSTATHFIGPLQLFQGITGERCPEQCLVCPKLTVRVLIFILTASSDSDNTQ